MNLFFKAENFTYPFRLTLKVWSCFFVLVLLPFDFIYRLDSFIKYLSPMEILVDTAAMVFFFLALTLMAAIFAGVSSFLISFLVRHKMTSVTLWLNGLIASVITSYYFLKMFKFWINKVSTFQFQISPYIKMLFLFSLTIWGIFILVKFQNTLLPKIKEIVEKLFKVVAILFCIALFIISYRVVTFFFANDIDKKKSALETKLGMQLATSPNVILITFDALTAQNMSLYGYHRNTTRDIDDLAKTSYMFERMFSNCNYTVPSILSIITSKYPSTHKVNSNFDILNLNVRHENLINHLKQNGYETTAVVSNWFTHPLYQRIDSYFDYLAIPIETKNLSIRDSFSIIIAPVLAKIGIHSFVWIDRWVEDIFGSFVTRRLPKFYPKNIRTKTPSPPELAFERAKEYMKIAKPPFFLWVHIFPPHDPYLPSNNFNYTFLNERTLDTYDKQHRYLGFYPEELQFEIDKLRSRYDEHVLYADSEFGKFLGFLRQQGYADNSIVIVSADHGESFEKGWAGHGGPYLYQPLIHIPLLIRMPNQRIARKVASNAEQIDIAPTILDLLQVDIPIWMEGTSLKKAMHGNSIDNRPKFSMTTYTDPVNFRITETSAVIKDTFKYVYSTKQDKGELYNLERDPKELNNLAEVEKERATEMKSFIFERIIKQK